VRGEAGARKRTEGRVAEDSGTGAGGQREKVKLTTDNGKPAIGDREAKEGAVDDRSQRRRRQGG
jgi:hypothetical protein